MRQASGIPIRGNVVKEIRETVDMKTSGSNITKASCSNMCTRVNSPLKIEANDDNWGKTTVKTNSTTDKKCSFPSIKAPLLPTTRIQVPSRMQSASIRKPLLVPTRTIVALPVGGEDKPNTMASGKPIAVSRSTSTLSCTKAQQQILTRDAVPQGEESAVINEAKKSEMTPMIDDAEQTSFGTSISCHSSSSDGPQTISATLGDAETKEQTLTEASTAKESHTISKSRSATELRHNLASQYSYTPLKMIVDDLLLLHHDSLPSEICPMLNRSPSIVGVNSDGYGLVSERSPKLDIPRRRYCGRMIHQHPLDKHIHRMRKPIRRYRDVYKSTFSSESSDEYNRGSSLVLEVYRPDQLAAKFGGHSIKNKEGGVSLPKQQNEGDMSKQNSYLKLYTEKKSLKKAAVRQPSPFVKSTSYLDMYRKKPTIPKNSLTRGDKYSVLPPIEQPAPLLKPTSYLEMYKKKETYRPLPSPKTSLKRMQYSVLPPIGVTTEHFPTPPSQASND